MAQRPVIDRPALMQIARNKLAENPDQATQAKRKRVDGRQEVSRDKCYPLEQFLQITGLSRPAFRRALDSGLKCKTIGDGTWVTGEAWFNWLMSDATAKKQQPEKVQPKPQTTRSKPIVTCDPIPSKLVIEALVEYFVREISARLQKRREQEAADRIARQATQGDKQTGSRNGLKKQNQKAGKKTKSAMPAL